jgi:THO complex subunit 2
MNSMGPPHAPDTGRPVESLPEIHARASAAWKRVVSLIGYFDLDPNRALDVILDIFSTNLSAHYSFFLELLAFSSWAPDVKTVSQVSTEGKPYRGKSFDEVLRIAEDMSFLGEKREPPELKKGGNRVLAQVLGFKFTHYQVGRNLIRDYLFAQPHRIRAPKSPPLEAYTT